MIKKHIAIIGAGNMGGAIIHGLLKQHIVSAHHIHATAQQPVSIARIRELGLEPSPTNIIAVKQSRIIILAVKPQQLREVLQEIRPAVTTRHLILSIAAGFAIQTIEHILGPQIPIIRAMPNLCATVGMSATAWTHNKAVTDSMKQTAAAIFASIGSHYCIADEHQLDAVTAIAGSGPAYIFYIVEQLSRAAASCGFDARLSQELVLQTLKGSTALLLNSPESPAKLRERVTSKGGTTAAAIHEFETSKLDTIILRAVEAAHKRAQELGSSCT